MAARGVAAAADELPIAAGLDDQARIAFGAGSSLDNFRLSRFLIVVEVPGVLAFRKIGAADEPPIAAQADGELALALRTFFVDRFLGYIASLNRFFLVRGYRH